MVAQVKILPLRRRGRRTTAHVSRHADHWDIRIWLPGGHRSRPIHLPRTVTEDEARKLAAQAFALANEVRALAGTTQERS